MDNQKLLVLEVGSDEVEMVFEEVMGRKPTDSEMGTVIDRIGDLYNAVHFEYVIAEIHDYIANVISEKFN